jgi:hypothetical protein
VANHQHPIQDLPAQRALGEATGRAPDGRSGWTHAHR